MPQTAIVTRAMVLLVVLLVASPAVAHDWPMWRFGPGRAASSDQPLADELHLQWVRTLPKLDVAWPDQDMMWFDRQYEPIVVGRRLFVGSSQTDSVTAYDTRTGAALWEFHADGPIRFAPAAWNERIFVGCDDGHLYCLDAADGRVVWKHRGGPSNRKLLGNERLISMWPVRGAPVVADGTVYYAAGIWPFMGIFLHALDAETGAIRWTNDGDGSRFMLQPHNTPSFAGVAPQGALAVEGDRLIVPGGRSIPAVYDRRTGRFLHYELAANGKRGGGSAVAAGNELIFNGGYTFAADKGDVVDSLQFSTLPIVDDRRAVYALGNKVAAVEFNAELFRSVDGKDRKGNPVQVRKLNFAEIWSTSLRIEGEVDLIRAGDKIFGCAGRQVFALEQASKTDEPKTVWTAEVDGTAVRVLAADDRLFVVTLEGSVCCFAADKPANVVRREHGVAAVAIDAATGDRAAAILRAADDPAGNAVVWGVDDGSLVVALLQASEMNVIAVDPDAAKVAALRTKLIDAGLYGRRAAALVGTPETLELPQYFASLMVCADADAAGVKWEPAAVARLFASLRPYDGRAWFDVDDAGFRRLEQIVREANLPRGKLTRGPRDAVLHRTGPLEGSADWTHEHADASNTRTSRDRLVKLPLGLLWFGGPSHDAILPRHGHGPQPQVVEGRVIIEGPDVLRATDVYTGRLLWERELPGIGALYDNTAHHPGANGTGANYISLADGIYAIHGPGCVRLDPSNGRTLREFALPPVAGASEPPTWNYVNVVDDYLVAGVDLPASMLDPRKRAYEDVVAVKRIYVLDRHDGRVLWSFDAKFQFRNNAICLGGGRLYCIDLLSTAEIEMLKRRGLKPKDKSKLHAFDLKSGKELWSTDDDVFGTWLSYSAARDVLVESGRPGRDVLKDEPKGMRAYRAAKGEVLWKDGHSGPAILHGDRILADRQACELLTGRLIQRQDPLTGRRVDWTWKRNYGCNTPQACENLLLFRSGAAGFCDLENDGGTGNFGGFRSSCTNNLIAAGGVLSVPDYTRTCSCDYQNQTSLALVHMPDVEIWSEFPLTEDDEICELALNLGAPGYRRDDRGRLWLHQFDGAKIEYDGEGYYCRHSSNVVGDGVLNWVAASGCRGIRRLTLDPGRDDPSTFTVRLHFCDPDNDQPGARSFDLKLQGQTALEKFDPAATAGGRLRPVVREFRGIRLEAKQPLEIEFVSPSASSEPSAAPILNGVELVIE